MTKEEKEMTTTPKQQEPTTIDAAENESTEKAQAESDECIPEGAETKPFRFGPITFPLGMVPAEYLPPSPEEIAKASDEFLDYLETDEPDLPFMEDFEKMLLKALTKEFKKDEE